MTMKNIPNKIYLQIGEETPKDADFEELDEVTWCADKINPNDFEYVKMDKVINPKPHIKENVNGIVVKGELHQYVTSNNSCHKEGIGIETPICKKCSLYYECNHQVSVLHFCRDYKFGKGHFVNKGKIEIK